MDAGQIWDLQISECSRHRVGKVCLSVMFSLEFTENERGRESVMHVGKEEVGTASK